MWKRMIGVALAITACSIVASEPHRLAFDALGNARIGLQENELAAALGAPLTPTAPRLEDETCYYAVGAGLPPSVMLMIQDGRLARIDVYEPGVSTVSGAHVGMAEHELRRLYGARLHQEPHKYAFPEGHYLTLLAADRRHAMRFETDGEIVTSFYAGTTESVELSEGCQ